MSQFKTVTISILIGLILTACTTQQFKRMENLKTGMDKTDVLDSIGSPNSSKFVDGQHEWVYIYYKDDIKLAKKLFFQKDLLVKIEDYDLNLLATKSAGPVEGVTLEEGEAEELKKALTEKQSQQKHEEGFQDLE